MSRHSRAAWGTGYVLATTLSFPHPVAGRVLDLGWIAAWLGPACLLLALRGLAPGPASRLALALGWAAHALVFHWIYVVTVVYGHAPPVVGMIAPAALALYPALFNGAFGGLTAAWTRGSETPVSPFVAAALWTALDQGRSWLLTGFPWAVLGYAQHHNPLLMALAPFAGVYGLSFATALGGAGLAQLAAGGADGRRRAALAWTAVALLHAVGGLSLLRDEIQPTDTLRVAVLQGNIDQGVKWSRDWAERTLEIYEDLSLRAAERGAQLIVWPETAAPGSPDIDPGLRERLEQLARTTGATLVVGAVGIDPNPDGSRRFYDSAYVLAPDGAPSQRYDKAHLVPFGEYVPLRGLLGHFLGAVARGIASLDVSAGSGPRTIEIEAAGPRQSVSAGVPICYELLFPDLVRRFVDEGAELLLAITNDAWYGRTGAPYQFLAITALRSAETRVWTGRAANTGVSAFIDERGRVRAQTPIFERDLLVADVPLRRPPLGGSFYARHGDLFAWGCWGVVGWVVSMRWRPGARKST